MGVTASLNRGFRLAKGAYIARMDSDDVSLPNRFERQLEYMDTHKDVIVCGTFAEEIGDKNGKRCRHIPEQKEYQCGVLFGNVYGLIHPTAFFRVSVLRENGIQYDENIPTAQDYAMWAECCRYGEIANVEEILFQYRVHQKQISTAKRELQQRCTMYVQKKILNHLFPDISDQTVRVHFDYCTSCRVTSDMRRWFQTIAEANDVARYVDREALLAFIGQFLCNKALVSANQTGNPIALCELLMRSAKAERKVVLQSIAARLSKKLRH